MDVNCPPGQRCVEVLSAITAVLEPGDNPDVVADVIVMGIKDTVAGGSLFAPLPAGTVYLCKDAELTVGPTMTPMGQPVAGLLPVPMRGPAMGSPPPAVVARLLVQRSGFLSKPLKLSFCEEKWVSFQRSQPSK
jgi:hypothetical protein